MVIELYDSHRHGVAPEGAHLTFNGGPILDAPKLIGVFVDDFPLGQEMGRFLDWLVTSPTLGELTEYTTRMAATHLGDAVISSGNTVPSPPPGSPPPPPPPPGPPPPPVSCPPGCVPQGTGHHRHRHKGRQGSRGTMALLRNRVAASTITDGQLRALIGQKIGEGLLPQPDSQTLYILFLPVGMIVQSGSDASCQVFCGYHDQFTLSGRPVFYAIMPYPSCDGCLGGNTAFDALTGTLTHEISEAITDPVPGQGWYDTQNGEIGDICAWQFKSDGGNNVQLEWSNQHGACI